MLCSSCPTQEWNVQKKQFWLETGLSFSPLSALIYHERSAASAMAQTAMSVDLNLHQRILVRPALKRWLPVQLQCKFAWKDQTTISTDPYARAWAGAWEPMTSFWQLMSPEWVEWNFISIDWFTRGVNRPYKTLWRPQPPLEHWETVPQDADNCNHMTRSVGFYFLFKQEWQPTRGEKVF